MKKFFFGLAKLIGAVLFLFVAWFVTSVWWPLSVPEAPPRAASILIKNTNVVDVLSGEIKPEQDIFVRDGVIIQVGSNLNVVAEQIVDGNGRFAIPGLFDMHMHSFKMSPSLTHPMFVAAGVTAVRDLGGCLGIYDAWVACADEKRAWTFAAKSGDIVGPKYDHIASMQIDGGNEIPDALDVALGAGTADGARARVSFDKARGIDFLKTYTMLPPDGYFALAAAALESDMYLAGHLPFKVSALDAIKAGQRSFEHALFFIWECFPDIDQIRNSEDPFLLYDNQLRMRMIAEHDAEICQVLYKAMADAGVAFDPTHTTRKLDAYAKNEAFRSDERLKYIPHPLRIMWLQDADGMAKRAGEGGQESYDAIYNFGLQQTAQAHKAGVRVLVGTDAPDSFVFPGLAVHDEMSHLVDAGLSPLDALRAATLEPARFLGLDGKAGVVAVGSRADIVLLRSNPLEDISAVREIQSVINSGTYYDRAQLDELLSLVEANASSWTIWPKFIWQIYNSPLMLKQFAD